MFRIGIIGAGWIARKMVGAMAPLSDYCVYAIASRTLEKAQAFAEEFDIEKAYGSYEALMEDANVDLVYIATPHSHHYAPARLAIAHHKPVLVEKAFTANAREARELIAYAHQEHVFLTEAIWTRYMPMSHKIGELLQSGVIGEPSMLSATLCYSMGTKERILRPELCGGALLDLGVYVLNFARMYFGTEIEKTVSNCVLGPTGVDLLESISLTYAGHRMANLQAGALSLDDRQGIIRGPKGYIRVDNINCPERIDVVCNYELQQTILRPADMINGYEYQVYECRRCIEQGLIESPMMPHEETISIMQQMDDLRKEWGVRYPMDEA